MKQFDNYNNRDGETSMGSNLNRFLIMAMCLLMVSAVGSKKVIGYYKSKYDIMVEM